MASRTWSPVGPTGACVHAHAHARAVLVCEPSRFYRSSQPALDAAVLMQPATMQPPSMQAGSHTAEHSGPGSCIASRYTCRHVCVFVCSYTDSFLPTYTVRIHDPGRRYRSSLLLFSPLLSEDFPSTFPHPNTFMCIPTRPPDPAHSSTYIESTADTADTLY